MMQSEKPATLKAEPISLETARHRAEQAVEYYQKHIMLNRSSTVPPGEENTERARKLWGNVQDSLKYARSRDGFVNSKTSDQVNLLTRGGHRATIHGPHTGKTWSQNRHEQQSKKPVDRNIAQNNGPYLYRSNSNLDMDCIEYIDEDNHPHFSDAKREYGSTSSLDVLSTSSENFFAMLREYRNDNSDQRSPAPEKLHELLRGNLEIGKRGIRFNDKVLNGSVISEKSSDDVTQSPKTKTKFKHKDRKVRSKTITGETGSGIFKKLRGKEGESGTQTPVNVSRDVSADERLRQKAFVHYDCQSIGFRLNDVKNQESSSRNTTTGASAASVKRNSYVGDMDDPDIIADIDDGDGKNNDLVLSCPFFRNEVGGEEERTISLNRTTAHRRGHSLSNTPSQCAISYTRSPSCCGVAILDLSPTTSGQKLSHMSLHRGHMIEYVNHGASYYRHFFLNTDHQNYFGIDDNHGPVAVSIKRERLAERENNAGKAESCYQYRLIARTSQLTTLRGTILEDAVPASSRLSSSKGLPIKDVLEYVVPELQTSSLHVATSGQKTCEEIQKLDEQGVSVNYKIGVMYCKAGQSTEEEMYNNENAGPAFEEFLDLIGHKVRLKGFEKYRAQLDNKTDSTGIHSVYTTFGSFEIMFHVSTLLPYTPNNKQQLLRKRHIGNDIVTVVFQEPGAMQFTPKVVRSQFQHVFIIIRAHNPCTEDVKYSIAVTRSKDVPPFGPPIPEGAKFSKSLELTDFLLAKFINAENAAHRSEKFQAMATRTRQAYLKDLASNYITTSSLETGSKLSKFGRSSGRKKDKNKGKVVPDLFGTGAVVWSIQVEDFGLAAKIYGMLGIAAERIVIIEESSKDVIFTVQCSYVIGWTTQTRSLRLYYNQSDCILLKPSSGDPEELQEIISRLTAITSGTESVELSLKRNGMGQLGFHIQAEGIVTDVEHYGFAWEAGLRKGSRLVEICKVAAATLTHEQVVDLLKTSATVKIVVVPAHADGKPRGEYSLGKNCTHLSKEYHKRASSLKRGMSPQHAYTDSTGSSGRSSVDGRTFEIFDGHPAKHNTTDSAYGTEEHRLRSGSRDSIEVYGGSAQHWHNRSSYSLAIKTGKWYDSPSVESSSHGNYSQIPESSHMPAQQTAPSHVPSRKISAPAGDYTAVQHGNISVELMKQSQNTKYLLSQGPDSSCGGSNLTDTSFSSGSSQTTGIHGSYHGYHGYVEQGERQSREDIPANRKKADLLSTNSKGRPHFPLRKLDSSPQSSANSSPRSSNRNLSGMSSEESLNARLRLGVTTKATKTQPTSNFQEELMRLIDPDISVSDLTGILKRSPPHRQSRRIPRTMSDESLHSQKGIMLADVQNNLSDVLFTSTKPRQFVTKQKQDLTKQQRLSPGAMVDATPPLKQEVPGAKSSCVPLPKSTAGLDWSNLVDVATKAIEDINTKCTASSEEKCTEERNVPTKAQRTTDISNGTAWQMTATEPCEQLLQWEQRVEQLQQDLEQERRENAILEDEVQELRTENIHLQEESQTAAAQLRKFTEWFFNTIDHQ